MVKVKDAGPFERIVTLAVAEEAIQAAKGPAARRLAGEIKIKGFRPGKAPMKVIAQLAERQYQQTDPVALDTGTAHGERSRLQARAVYFRCQPLVVLQAWTSLPYFLVCRHYG